MLTRGLSCFLVKANAPLILRKPKEVKVLENSGLWKSVGSVASGMTSEPGGSNGGSEGMGFEEDRLRLWP